MSKTGSEARKSLAAEQGPPPKVTPSLAEMTPSLAYGGFQHITSARPFFILKIDRAGRCRWPIGFSIGTKVSWMVNSYVFFTGFISILKP